MTSELHPTEVTDREQRLGFIVDHDANPRKHYLGEPETVPAVVCPVGPSDRVIKLRDPNGTIHYRAQRYGSWAFSNSEEKKWLPAGDAEHFDPDEAVTLAQAQVGKEVEPKIVVADPNQGEQNFGG